MNTIPRKRFLDILRREPITPEEALIWGNEEKAQAWCDADFLTTEHGYLRAEIHSSFARHPDNKDRRIDFKPVYGDGDGKISYFSYKNPYGVRFIGQRSPRQGEVFYTIWRL